MVFATSHERRKNLSSPDPNITYSGFLGLLSKGLGEKFSRSTTGDLYGIVWGTGDTRIPIRIAESALSSMFSSVLVASEDPFCTIEEILLGLLSEVEAVYLQSSDRNAPIEVLDYGPTDPPSDDSSPPTQSKQDPVTTTTTPAATPSTDST